MNKIINVSTKSDIVSFIIFKRKFRRLFHYFLMILVLFLLIFILFISYFNKKTVAGFAGTVFGSMENIFGQLFATKISNVRFSNKDSLLNNDEIDSIKKKISNNKKISKAEMSKIVKTIAETNSLIDSIYIRRNLSNNELVVTLEEKKIIGIFYNCSVVGDDKCKKNLISANNNKILPYHNIKNNDEILKVYGKYYTIDIQKIYKILKKYLLLNNILYIKTYSNGRFDATLKNNLTVKFPSKDLETAIRRFNKLNSEYSILSKQQNIKYIDLRMSDKVVFG